MKVTKVWGIRHSLIGDTVMSLPVLNILKRVSDIDEMFVTFVIAKKCAQASSLYLNHPLIDKIWVTEKAESYGENDFRLMKQHDIVFNCAPQHESELWYNQFTCVEETVRMSGIPLVYYKSLPEDEKFPKLYRWWDRQPFKNKNNIALWPIAGYGGGNMGRNPSVKQWEEIIAILVREGFCIHHFGWHQEPVLGKVGYANHTRLSFIDQIKKSLDCDFILGVDSGSTWVTAAYHELPQINILRPRVEHRHINNPYAFEPIGKKSSSFLVEGETWSNLNIEKLILYIKERWN